ncbi:MAG: hypothetical protein A3D92_18445 [Bacteroidetes bacterium RIFCSPHIGHO2_02_FULL_44_7]|nr:MAG: hypothetical protein A3D92_18445 [Bacteroidetes bacterium RIFCSPHIGHO2_02_FULL_44_7]
MRHLLIITLLLFSAHSFAQKDIELKKKFLGAYKGTIPSYMMDTGEQIIEVSSTDIFVNITDTDITISIGNNALHGTYEVMFEAKDYFLLDVKIDDQLANERILVYKRGKHISRDGMFPQPLAELSKV